MNETRPLSKAPIQLANQVAADLGSVLELEVGDSVVKFRKKPRLFWFPEKKALAFIVTDGKPRWLNPKSSKKTLNDIEARFNTTAVQRAYSKFMGRESNSAYTIRFPKRKGEWFNAGAVRRLDYKSDKFGKSQEYTHGHGSGVRLYTNKPKSGRGPELWVIKGGRLTVTERGIIN